MRKQRAEKYRDEVRKVNTGLNRKNARIHEIAKERDRLKSEIERLKKRHDFDNATINGQCEQIAAMREKLEAMERVIEKARHVKRIWMGTIDCLDIFPMFDALSALDRVGDSSCIDCGAKTKPGPGSARCPSCWDDRGGK